MKAPINRDMVLRFLIRDDAGATAIEYAFLLALIALAAIGAISALGSSVDGTLFGPVNAKFHNAVEGN